MISDNRATAIVVDQFGSVADIVVKPIKQSPQQPDVPQSSAANPTSNAFVAVMLYDQDGARKDWTAGSPRRLDVNPHTIPCPQNKL